MEDFDRILRDKLAALPPEGAPDWADLAERLDGESFDALLRRRMPAHTPLRRVAAATPAVTGWAALEARLPAAHAPSPDATDPIPADTAPADALAANLVAADAAGEHFDRLVARAVADAPLAATPDATWNQLSRRMDTLWPLRRRLVRYKALEIAAVIALLFTFGPLLHERLGEPGDGGIVGAAAEAARGGKQGPPHAGVADAIVREPGNEPATAPAAVVAAASGAAREGTVPDATAAPGADGVGADGIDADGIGADATTGRSGSARFAPLQLVRSALDWAGLLGPDAENEAQGVAGGGQPASDAAPIGAASPEAVPPGTAALRAAALTANLLTADPLGPIALSSLALPPTAVAAPRPGRWRVGVSAAATLWSVNTPTDAVVNRGMTRQVAPGFSVGITAARRTGRRTEVEVGAYVAPLSYRTNLPSLISTEDAYKLLTDETESLGEDISAEAFSAISFTTVQVPVDFRVNLLRPDRQLRVWAKAGAAVNAILGSSYDLRTVNANATEARKVLSNSPTASFINDNAALPRVQSADQGFSDSREFAPGFFDGGSLGDNTYLSARLGIEAELALSPRLSVYSGVDYARHLRLQDGVGPNADQLNAAGLSLGARVTL